MLERRGYGETFMLVNLMLCSLLGSITVLCSAAISNFIDNFFNGDAAVLLSPVPYLIIPILFSTGVLQLRHLDKALEYHDNARVVPTYYVTFTLCSISGGGVVYQDFWGFTWRTAGGFVCGCALCFYGVYLITKKGTVADKYDFLIDEKEPIDLGAAESGTIGERRASGERRQSGEKLERRQSGDRDSSGSANGGGVRSRGPSAERPAAPQPQVVRAQRAAGHRRAHSAGAPPLASAPALALPVLIEEEGISRSASRAAMSPTPESPPPHGTAPPTSLMLAASIYDGRDDDDQPKLGEGRSGRKSSVASDGADGGAAGAMARANSVGLSKSTGHGRSNSDSGIPELGREAELAELRSWSRWFTMQLDREIQRGSGEDLPPDLGSFVPGASSAVLWRKGSGTTLVRERYERSPEFTESVPAGPVSAPRRLQGARAATAPSSPAESPQLRPYPPPV